MSIHTEVLRYVIKIHLPVQVTCNYVCLPRTRISCGLVMPPFSLGWLFCDAEVPWYFPRAKDGFCVGHWKEGGDWFCKCRFLECTCSGWHDGDGEGALRHCDQVGRIRTSPSDTVGSNLSSGTYQLCERGQGAQRPSPQFPHLWNEAHSSTSWGGCGWELRKCMWSAGAVVCPRKPFSKHHASFSFPQSLGCPRVITHRICA